jgi:hypothetical protein
MIHAPKIGAHFPGEYIYIWDDEDRNFDAENYCRAGCGFCVDGLDWMDITSHRNYCWRQRD